MFSMVMGLVEATTERQQPGRRFMGPLVWISEHAERRLLVLCKVVIFYSASVVCL